MRDAASTASSGPIVGVLSLVLGGEYYGGVLSGIQRTVAQRGGTVVGVRTLQLRQDPTVGFEPCRFVPYSLASVDGIILVLDAVGREDLISIQETGKPIISVSTSYADLNIPEVAPDNRTGIIELVQHLVNHGHTRIGFVGHLTNHDARERFDAYRAGLREAGIEPDPTLLFHAANDVDTGGRVAAENFIAAGMPCTAVCIATDDNALGFMTRIQEGGFGIPSDLAIVSFDDSPANALYTPALTTVQVKPDDVGDLAARTLLAMLDGRALAAVRILAPGRVVYRQSCGCWAGQAAPAVNSGRRISTVAIIPSLITWILQELGVPSGGAADEGLADLIDATEKVVGAVVDVLGGRPLPIPGGLAAAWRTIVARAGSLEGASRAVGLLRDFAQERLDAMSSSDPAISTNVGVLLNELQVELLYAARHPFVARGFESEATKHQSYNASKTLLEQSTDSPRDLSWLRVTPAVVACLGLWRDDVPGSGLVLESVYSRYGLPQLDRAESYPAERFPPLELFEQIVPEVQPQAVAVIPLQTATRDWGALAIMTPTETQGSAAADTVWQWSVLLVAALERERLIESLRLTEQKLILLAHHDSLTGLPNRALFYDRVDHLLSLSRRYQSPFAMMLLDLNKFKSVNDTMGHAAGDRLLQTVAERTKETLRDSDTIARLGGDEFAILVPGAWNAEAQEVADRVRSAVEQPIELDRGVAVPSVSIGIAVFPADGETYGALFEHADHEMYAEKHAS